MDLVGVRERLNGMMMMLGICRPSTGEEEEEDSVDEGEVGRERVARRDLGSNVECNKEGNELSSCRREIKWHLRDSGSNLYSTL